MSPQIVNAAIRVPRYWSWSLARKPSQLPRPIRVPLRLRMQDDRKINTVLQPLVTPHLCLISFHPETDPCLKWIFSGHIDLNSIWDQMGKTYRNTSLPSEVFPTACVFSARPVSTLVFDEGRFFQGNTHVVSASVTTSLGQTLILIDFSEIGLNWFAEVADLNRFVGWCRFRAAPWFEWISTLDLDLNWFAG